MPFRSTNLVHTKISHAWTHAINMLFAWSLYACHISDICFVSLGQIYHMWWSSGFSVSDCRSVLRACHGQSRSLSLHASCQPRKKRNTFLTAWKHPTWTSVSPGSSSRFQTSEELSTGVQKEVWMRRLMSIACGRAFCALMYKSGNWLPNVHKTRKGPPVDLATPVTDVVVTCECRASDKFITHFTGLQGCACVDCN